jgi:molybdopterin converting factor small subunit
MEVRVLLFGPERAAAGTDALRITLAGGGGTCADVRREVLAAAPSLASLLPAARFAVNHTFVPDSHPIRENDEVALIGLVSGG